jgi:hypothetical protein
MQKIYKSATYQYDKNSDHYNLIDADYYYHTGEIAAAKGASGGGGSSQPTQTVQKMEPWDGQKNYLADVFNQAQNQWTSQKPQYYADSTVVPFSPETETALQLQTQRALFGSPTQAAANQQLTDTLEGDYLYGGDAFNAAFDAASRRIIPQVNSMFANSGRTGSGLAQTAMTQALGDSFANQYGQERNNQMTAAAQAPQMAQLDYLDPMKLAEVGSQREALGAEYLQDDINRFNYYENLPAMKLQQYANLIQGNYGGTGTTSATGSTSSGSRSPLGGILGGAMMGSSFGWPGAAGGGILGGIMN